MQPSSAPQPRIVTLDAFLVVGLRIRTTPMAPEISQLWQQFAPRIDEVAHPAEPYTSYGVMHNFDAASQQFDYMAGVSVTLADSTLPSGMVAWSIPASNYAVFMSSLSSLGETFGHIFEHWLPGSDYEQADAPYFERYGEDFDPADPQSPVEIFLPVRRKPA